MNILSVRNYRRIRTAELVISDGVTLVCGRNGQGKTSLGEAARAALTSDPIPALGDIYTKRTKSRVADLVHKGADAASVTFKRDNGTLTEIKWPSCDVRLVGTGGPVASKLAVGFLDDSLVSRTKADRFVVLRDLLKAEPGYNDLWAWLTAKVNGETPPSVPEDMARMIWKTITEQDWTNTAAYAKEKGAVLQNSYKEVTGGKWGSVKAVGWRPEGWDLAWDNQPASVFVANLKQAEASYYAMIGVEAVSKEKRQQLESLAASMPSAIQKRDQVLEREKALLAEIETHRKKCDAFIPPDDLAVVHCPNCKAELSVIADRGHGGGITAYALRKATKRTVTDKETKALRLEAAGLDGKGQKLKDDLAEMNYRHKPAAEAAVKAAEAAGVELAALAPVADGPDAVELAKAKAAYDHAGAVVGMIEAVDKAKDIHAKILVNLHIQAALGDLGVRAAVLQVKIEEMNQHIAAWSAVAQLGDVVISEKDASITVNGTPYYDLSGAESLRLRVLLQVAIAKADGSEMVVVDIQDSTDRKHILGLVKMLNAADMPALMVCHMNNPDDAPDLESEQAKAHGYRGLSYWVENGEVAPLSSVREG